MAFVVTATRGRDGCGRRPSPRRWALVATRWWPQPRASPGRPRRTGRRELEAGVDPSAPLRRPGAGRKKLEQAFVSVGCDHDTPAFAVAAIRRWWATMGSPAYPEANELFITADAGGSNGFRSRGFKAEMKKLADDFGLRVRVSHLPPGTSKIEHRLSNAEMKKLALNRHEFHGD